MLCHIQKSPKTPKNTQKHDFYKHTSKTCFSYVIGTGAFAVFLGVGQAPQPNPSQKQPPKGGTVVLYRVDNDS